MADGKLGVFAGYLSPPHIKLLKIDWLETQRMKSGYVREAGDQPTDKWVNYCRRRNKQRTSELPIRKPIDFYKSRVDHLETIHRAEIAGRQGLDLD